MKDQLRGSHYEMATTNDQVYLDALKELTTHPLRMQIFFYLVTFQEISLSDLSSILRKPKTTVHHHVRQLEKKGILIAREETVKNYKEKYYSLNSDLMSFIREHGSEEHSIDNENFSIVHVVHAIKAYSSFLHAILERFAVIVETEHEQWKDTFLHSNFMIVVTSQEKYSRIMEKIKEAINSESSSDEQASCVDENSWVIALAGMPYGLLFRDLMKKITDRKYLGEKRKTTTSEIAS